jgi:hypothetical protein
VDVRGLERIKPEKSVAEENTEPAVHRIDSSEQESHGLRRGHFLFASRAHLLVRFPMIKLTLSLALRSDERNGGRELQRLQTLRFLQSLASTSM